jgi:hypothetical protein
MTAIEQLGCNHDDLARPNHEQGTNINRNPATEAEGRERSGFQGQSRASFIAFANKSND